MSGDSVHALLEPVGAVGEYPQLTEAMAADLNMTPFRADGDRPPRE